MPEDGKFGMAFGATLALIHLAALTGIKAGLAFLGSFANPVVGVIVLLIGGGIAVKANWGSIPGGLGLGLVGIGFALQGLGDLGLFPNTMALAATTLGLALIVTQWALKSGLLSKLGIRV